MRMFIVDCESVWNTIHEREHLLICNPEKVAELPVI